MHPNGKFVYGSNRGHNSIAIFAIDETTGEIKAVGHQGEGVKMPRNFNIDPSGKWMLVANQDGHNIIVFEIDGKTGDAEADRPARRGRLAGVRRSLSPGK